MSIQNGGIKFWYMLNMRIMILLIGVFELRDLGKAEMRSANGEDFSSEIQAIHEQVKQQLHDSNIKYKRRVDLKKR